MWGGASERAGMWGRAQHDSRARANNARFADPRCLAAAHPLHAPPGRQAGAGGLAWEAPRRRARRRRPPAHTNLPCQCTALPAAAAPREPPNWSLVWGGAWAAAGGNNLQPSAGGRAPACGPQSTGAAARGRPQGKRCSTPMHALRQALEDARTVCKQLAATAAALRASQASNQTGQCTTCPLSSVSNTLTVFPQECLKSTRGGVTSTARGAGYSSELPVRVQAGRGSTKRGGASKRQAKTDKETASS